jgi:hypothetical protein
VGVVHAHVEHDKKHGEDDEGLEEGGKVHSGGIGSETE